MLTCPACGIAFAKEIENHGHLIREARERAGFSQRECATLLGVAVPQLWIREHDTRLAKTAAAWVKRIEEIPSEQA